MDETLALQDRRGRLDYRTYLRRVERLAARFAAMGLTSRLRKSLRYWQNGMPASIAALAATSWRGLP